MIRRWWAAREARERYILLAGAVVLLPLLWYLLLAEPLYAREQRAVSRLQSARSAYREMQEIHDQVLARRGKTARTASAPKDSGQRLSLATRLAEQQGLKDVIGRISPRTDGSFSLWLRPRPFNELAPWLITLREQGIRIVSMNYDPAARGEQELRLR